MGDATSGLPGGAARLGLPLYVSLYGDDGSAQLALSGPFEFHEPGGEVRTCDPETHGWQEMAELLALQQDQVARATAWKDARLRVDFTSGRAISAHSTGRYDSWEVSAKDWKIVGTPGEVLTWGQGSRALNLKSPEFAEPLDRGTGDPPSAGGPRFGWQ